MKSLEEDMRLFHKIWALDDSFKNICNRVLQCIKYAEGTFSGKKSQLCISEFDTYEGQKQLWTGRTVKILQVLMSGLC